jgi:hypothetical protein
MIFYSGVLDTEAGKQETEQIFIGQRNNPIDITVPKNDQSLPHPSKENVQGKSHGKDNNQRKPRGEDQL